MALVLSGPHGLGSVRPDLVALEATRRLVGVETDRTIPAADRALAEEFAAADPRWREAAAVAAERPAESTERLALRMAPGGERMRRDGVISLLIDRIKGVLAGKDQDEDDRPLRKVGGGRKAGGAGAGADDGDRDA